MVQLTQGGRTGLAAIYNHTEGMGKILTDNIETVKTDVLGFRDDNFFL
jgi:hypothetical protein